MQTHKETLDTLLATIEDQLDNLPLDCLEELRHGFGEIGKKWEYTWDKLQVRQSEVSHWLEQERNLRAVVKESTEELERVDALVTTVKSSDGETLEALDASLQKLEVYCFHYSSFEKPKKRSRGKQHRCLRTKALMPALGTRPECRHRFERQELKKHCGNFFSEENRWSPSGFGPDAFRSVAHDFPIALQMISLRT